MHATYSYNVLTKQCGCSALEYDNAIQHYTLCKTHKAAVLAKLMPFWNTAKEVKAAEEKVWKQLGETTTRIEFVTVSSVNRACQPQPAVTNY